MENSNTIHSGQKGNSWATLLAEEKSQDYFKKIIETINRQRSTGVEVYPHNQDLFNAFKLTKCADLKIVIIGQDPYHGPGQAHGLAFSVQKGVSIPPSLQNIYKELKNEFPDYQIPEHGDLSNWAQQGVLLLNAVLSVQARKPGSHAKIGWQQFTDAVISKINENFADLVFLLWGSFAQKKAEMIDPQKHHILTSSHPSPFSVHRGFFGCNHFIQANQILTDTGREPIQW